MDNPEFQRDMLQTVEDSVARMNHLLSQLKADQAPIPQATDPAAIAAAVAAEFSVVVEIGDADRGCVVTIAPDKLRSAIGHLVQNALDASSPGDPIVVRAHRSGSRFVIEIVDRGVGMDEAFIRNELFVPFRSTKSSGYGIGAFQTRELIRMAGGDLEVVSRPDVGTTMRVNLPLVDDREAVEPPAAA
jgi:signal transduction histidine kinase